MGMKLTLGTLSFCRKMFGLVVNLQSNLVSKPLQTDVLAFVLSLFLHFILNIVL